MDLHSMANLAVLSRHFASTNASKRRFLPVSG
jgi:hypothetical protein